MSCKPRRLQRREFLAIGVTATLAGPAASCIRSTQGAWRFFTVEQARTVEAICELLIPEDQDPGARQAGVACYIDLQLSGRFRRHQGSYRQGIGAVEAASRSRSQRAFADMSKAEQAEVMAGIEKSAKPFFDLILAHAMQGYYGDPRHGGNRDGVSWKMLGLPFPPVRGRAHFDRRPA